MYISYAVGLGIVAVLSVLVWAVTAWGLIKDVIAAVVLFLPLAPAITLFSRVLWIYLDQTVDPEQTPQ
jgi:divalent metal cation (Fe/Co/Zn/Cd) transporter